MELVWVMLTFFIFITVIFIVLAITFPEWFGITGKKALEIHKHQEGDEEDTSAPTDKS